MYTLMGKTARNLGRLSPFLEAILTQDKSSKVCVHVRMILGRAFWYLLMKQRQGETRP